MSALRNKLEPYLKRANVMAFLAAIRLGEGTSDSDDVVRREQPDDDYRRIVGGKLFDDFSDHPRVSVWIPRYKVHSTAAGAYQIIWRTWRGVKRAMDLPDFSPHSQDLAAICLINWRGAIDDVSTGNIAIAIDKCRMEWASLPGSPYGQRTETLDKVLAEYQSYGGMLA